MTIGQVFQTRGFDFRLERIDGKRAIVRGLQSGKRATLPVEQLDRYLTAERGGDVATVKHTSIVPARLCVDYTQEQGAFCFEERG